MAAPRVVNSAGTNGTTAATNVVVNLPGSLVSGNYLVLICRKAAGTQTTPSGWAERINDSSDASDDNLLICTKKSNGAEGATVTINGSTSAKFSAACWQITDCQDPDNTTYQEVFTAITTGTSTAPNAASIDISAWGNNVIAHLFGALGGWEGEQTSPPTYPTNYTHGQQAADSGTAGVVATNTRVAGGWRQLAAGANTEDPGAFTISVSDDWGAIGIAIPGVVTHRQSLADTTDGSSYTTASFTPGSNELLLVFVRLSDSGSVTSVAVTDSNGGTYTQVAVDGTTNRTMLFVADQFAAGGVAITVNAALTGGTATGAVMAVTAVWGGSRTGTSAILQSTTGSGIAASTPALTFGANVSQENPTIGYLGVNANPAGMTPPTDWVEELDTGYATPARGIEYVTRGRAFASTTMTWGSAAAGTWQGIAVEMDMSAAPAAGGPKNLLMMMGVGI